ncbi:CAP-Gly domain-containing linker protein 4-like isoform X2 [Asterias rubens]|uniref:CAP-Gly domain-containing linker protein 4-like isoform X2 n=1 Tax=Asterias rubens TaxID=7604 RepID=UPI0014557511|nr:CAP-Gly domain-containing linker protein 4-like isoform X2 [Asterias rubens]
MEEDQTPEHNTSLPSLSPNLTVIPSCRTQPTVHPVSDAPLCAQCRDLQLAFFDPQCPGCWSLAQDTKRSVGELFAIVRQWVPQVQRSLCAISQEIFKRDFHVDDRDGLTDMTLLHYASKAGSEGISDRLGTLQLIQTLLDNGATPELQCRWTHMTALHYAAFFDVVPAIRLLLKATEVKDIENKCSEFDNGTALHIAASNGCLESVRCLLQLGANCRAKDDQGRIPLLCVPDSNDFMKSGWEVTAGKLRQLLHPDSTFERPKYAPQTYDDVPSKVLLSSQGLRIGDRVYVGDSKIGTLQFCGTTHFASGLWAGVALDEPDGKNNGSVAGISYFECPSNHGIFAPLSKISKDGSPRPGTPKADSGVPLAVIHRKIDVSHVSPRVDTGLRTRLFSSINRMDDIEIGDRVTVAGQEPRHGTVRYSGHTQFASGWWFGIELDKPHGKNDGSVAGVRYFTCSLLHGVFAHPSKITRCNLSLRDSCESSVSCEGLEKKAAIEK